MLLTIWLVTVVTALYLYLRQVYSKLANTGVRHLPPVPFFGNLGWVMLKREHMLEAIMRSLKAFPNDRIVGQYDLLEPVYIINDLELVKKITLKDFDYFVDRQAFLDDTDPLFGRNLLVLKGDEWKAMRSTLSPAFTSSKIRLMVPFMMEVGEQMIKFMKQKIEESGEFFFDVEGKDLATRYANDVIASCAFGLKTDSFKEDNNPFYRISLGLTTTSFRRLLVLMANKVSPYIPRLFNLRFADDKEVEFYNELILGSMKYREDNKIVRNDMIDILLQAKKGQLTHDNKDMNDVDAGFATVEESAIGKKNYDKAWTDTDLVAQAVLFLFAGFETVSTMMAFMLHELALNPDVQERLYREILENEERNDGKFDYNSVQHMKYLDMVVTETMRLWSPAAFTNRSCVKAYNVGKAYEGAPKDCIIPVGANVTIPIWAFHHNPDYFPNPKKFDPERFSPENKDNIKPFTYQPFGMGPRNCIGDEWKAMRSTLSPAFTSSKIRLMVPFMMEVGEQMIKFMKQKIEESGEFFFDVEGKDLATRYANDVIASCAFGLKTDSFKEDNNPFYRISLGLTTTSFRRLLVLMANKVSPYIPRLFNLRFADDKEVEFYNELILGSMKYREDNKIVRNDMIDILLQAKKGQLTHDNKDMNDVDAGFATVEESAIGKKNYDKAWTDTDLVAQAVLFLFAGFETVSTMMAFMLHELALNPDVQERLYREILENEERNDGKFDYNSVQHMKYLDMVVTETMRLWSPAAFTNRSCVKAYNVGKAYEGAPKDCIIPVGANVTIPIWAFHHNPDYFPNPKKFDPERFSPENKDNIKPFTYQPFGMGPRNCIGSRFALCEVKVMAYQLLQHFEVSANEKTSNPARLAKDGFSMKIDGGAWVRLKLR